MPLSRRRPPPTARAGGRAASPAAVGVVEEDLGRDGPAEGRDGLCSTPVTVPSRPAMDHDVVGGVLLGDLAGQHRGHATGGDVLVDHGREVHVEDVVGAAHRERARPERLDVGRHPQQQVAVAVGEAALGRGPGAGLRDDAAEAAAVAVQAPRATAGRGSRRSRSPGTPGDTHTSAGRRAPAPRGRSRSAGAPRRTAARAWPARASARPSGTPGPRPAPGQAPHRVVT